MGKLQSGHRRREEGGVDQIRVKSFVVTRDALGRLAGTIAYESEYVLNDPLAVRHLTSNTGTLKTIVLTQ